MARYDYILENIQRDIEFTRQVLVWNPIDRMIKKLVAIKEKLKANNFDSLLTDIEEIREYRDDLNRNLDALDLDLRRQIVAKTFKWAVERNEGKAV